MNTFKKELSKNIQDRLGKHFGSQRLISDKEEKSHLIILHEVPKHNSRERTPALFYYAGDKWLTTYGNNDISSLEMILDSYNKKYLELDKKVDDAKLASELQVIAEELLPIVRAAKNMSTTLQDARKAIGNIMIDHRDYAYEINRSLELLYEDCKNKIDSLNTYTQERTNELNEKVLKQQQKLNILMSIFLPLTAIGSAFGMGFVTDETQNFILVLFVSFISIFLGFMIKDWVAKKD